MVWNGERRTRRNEGGIIYISVLAVVGEDACIRAERSGLVQLISWFMTSRQARKIDSRQKSCVLIDFTFDRIFPDLAIFFFSFSKKGTKQFRADFPSHKEKIRIFSETIRKQKVQIVVSTFRGITLKYHTFSMNFEFLNIFVRLFLESNKITIFHPARLKIHLKIARNYKKVIRKTTIESEENWTQKNEKSKQKRNARKVDEVGGELLPSH